MFKLTLKTIPIFSSAFHRHFSNIKVARVGIVGLGNIGEAVAKNVLKNGYNLAAVCDLDTTKMNNYPEHMRQGSLKKLTEETDVVVTALGTPADVKKAMGADDGILNGIHKNSVWVDHTTTDYEQTIRLAQEVSDRGGSALECPLTGGMALLKQGKMTTFVGGEKEVYVKCRDLLKLSCNNVLYMGEMGSATITKVISNMLAATHLVSTGEALFMAKRCGVDMRAFFDGIRLSAGNSFVFETEGPLAFQGNYNPEFALALHCKDLNLGYNLARTHSVPMPLHGLVEQIYNQARFKYGDEAGSSHPAKLMPDALNDTLKIEGFDNWTYSVEPVEGGSLGVVQKNIKEIGAD